MILPRSACEPLPPPHWAPLWPTDLLTSPLYEIFVLFQKQGNFKVNTIHMLDNQIKKTRSVSVTIILIFYKYPIKSKFNCSSGLTTRMLQSLEHVHSCLLTIIPPCGGSLLIARTLVANRYCIRNPCNFSFEL